MTKQSFTCPCCGYRTLSEFPGSYEICHVCFWEDDPVQILDPWYAGGANKPSLIEAQKNFEWFGACDEQGRQFVKGILPGDERDPEWRPAGDVDRPIVKRPRDIAELEWNNLNAWYYWRNNAV
jgi:hypothetical protein